MGGKKSQRLGSSAWGVAGWQHSVVARGQLLELGFSAKAIEHRIANGRLHSLYAGVYAVGRPELTQHGRWMAAVLACGPAAVLSHESAAALWGVRNAGRARVEVSLPAPGDRRRPGIVVHRRTDLAPEDVTIRHGIPVTTAACTLIDLAARLDRPKLEAALNEADKHDVVTLSSMLAVLARAPRRPGASRMRTILDDWTFTLTDSELERLFLPIVRAAGLPTPLTRRRVNGFRVDFHWPELGLVVETDGGRFHRTAAQQTKDRLRDQTHAAAGLMPLRFTHAQVANDPTHVTKTLRAVAARLTS